MKLKKVFLALGLFATMFSASSFSTVSAKSGWADNVFSAQPLLLNQVNFGYLDSGGDADFYSYYNNSNEIQYVEFGANPWGNNSSSLNYDVVAHIFDELGNTINVYHVYDNGMGYGDWSNTNLYPGWKVVWAIAPVNSASTGTDNQYRTRVRLY
ncbi:hypothetical protein NQ117_14940 [Paenibacillus sp. SC116]|uniref:hypothetical protein n=1 Tax=Paenibacillus sp. SC116 TaxID=2968986 RepID=UPI00215ABCF2|nr:hypothetical protein [Paenibacillus sp. SC116]MCR8844976.1 hypothetical protein [Paenibacillus sp. SC116]